MQLYQWRGAQRNFGDELNALLWPRLLPGFFDDDPAELFLGIGSVLDARHDAAARKLVAGAGFGGYQPPPVLDDNWVVHWVRGPHTARLLRLDPACGVGDPAMLFAAPAEGGRSIGFMPHFESLLHGAWPAAAAAAGVLLIDPRGDPATILDTIRRCRLLLSEALHGVIVADALRVPWVALRPLAPMHRPKWHDWAAPLGLALRFHSLAPSSLDERLSIGGAGFRRPVCRLFGLARPVVGRLGRPRFVDRAARSLAAAAAAPPQLSAATALDRCRSRMLERLDALRREPRRSGASALHPRANSA